MTWITRAVTRTIRDCAGLGQTRGPYQARQGLANGGHAGGLSCRRVPWGHAMRPCKGYAHLRAFQLLENSKRFLARQAQVAPVITANYSHDWLWVWAGTRKNPSGHAHKPACTYWSDYCTMKPRPGAPGRAIAGLGLWHVARSLCPSSSPVRLRSFRHPDVFSLHKAPPVPRPHFLCHLGCRESRVDAVCLRVQTCPGVRQKFGSLVAAGEQGWLLRASRKGHRL